KLTDAWRLPFRVLSLRAGRGRCELGAPIRCALGTIRAGGRATVTTTAVATVAGEQVDAGAVTSTSRDPVPAGGLGTANMRIVAGAVRAPAARRLSAP